MANKKINRDMTIHAFFCVVRCVADAEVSRSCSLAKTIVSLQVLRAMSGDSKMCLKVKFCGLSQVVKQLRPPASLDT